MEKRGYDFRNYIKEHKAAQTIFREGRKKYKTYKKAIKKDKTSYLSKAPRVTGSHLALYTALLSFWNDARWPDIITPSVKAILNRSFLSEATYRKCLDDLVELGLLTFNHSKTKNEAIRIRMRPLAPRKETTSDSKIMHMNQKNESYSDPKIESYTKENKPLIKKEEKKENGILSELESLTTIYE